VRLSCLWARCGWAVALLSLGSPASIFRQPPARIQQAPFTGKSFASAVLCWLGRMPSASVMPGVLRYTVNWDPEKIPRPTLTRRLGRNGAQQGRAQGHLRTAEYLAERFGFVRLTGGMTLAAIA
jgi:hypothetical protein